MRYTEDKTTFFLKNTKKPGEVINADLSQLYEEYNESLKKDRVDEYD